MAENPGYPAAGDLLGTPYRRPHIWFVTIHPFEDGNGRVARALTELQLVRADASAQRFYSLSAQMRLERHAYYAQLEAAPKATSISQRGWSGFWLA